MEARIANRALAVVRRAAEIQGRSVGDFVVSAAQEAAQNITENERFGATRNPWDTSRSTGTGLGLAIVSRVIEEHHGSIRLEENQPVGARFIVELPVVPEFALATAAVQHA